MRIALQYEWFHLIHEIFSRYPFSDSDRGCCVDAFWLGPRILADIPAAPSLTHIVPGDLETYLLLYTLRHTLVSLKKMNIILIILSSGLIDRLLPSALARAGLWDGTLQIVHCVRLSCRLNVTSHKYRAYELVKKVVMCYYYTRSVV